MHTVIHQRMRAACVSSRIRPAPAESFGGVFPAGAEHPLTRKLGKSFAASVISERTTAPLRDTCCPTVPLQNARDREPSPRVVFVWVKKPCQQLRMRGFRVAPRTSKTPIAAGETLAVHRPAADEGGAGMTRPWHPLLRRCRWYRRGRWLWGHRPFVRVVDVVENLPLPVHALPTSTYFPFM